MKVMIVGAGGIARHHARACREVDAEIVGVCDVNPEAAARLGDEMGIAHRYDSLDALLAAQTADVAIVAVWGRDHLAVCRQLARSGRVRAVSCEKPLAMNAAEAAEIARVSAETGVLIVEAFRLRHQPIHLRVKELLEAGRIGDVLHVRNAMMSVRPVEQRRPELDWRFNKPPGGGVTYDIGCYAINHLRWAIGAEPTSVYAVGRWGDVSGVDEHVAAVAQFARGQTAEWCVSWQAGPRHVAEIFGTQGTIRLENAWGIAEQGALAIEITQPGGRLERLPFASASQFAAQLLHLRDCLETGRTHRLPITDSVAQMRVIDAVYESLRTGRPAQVGTEVGASR
jgi:predicted dehydrogenase